MSDILTELLLYHIKTDIGVFYNVMQESGAYCIRIHAELFYKYICYCYRVCNIRLSGRAENTVVRLFCQLISRLYFIKVVALSYFLYLVNKHIYCICHAYSLRLSLIFQLQDFIILLITAEYSSSIRLPPFMKFIVPFILSSSR